MTVIELRPVKAGGHVLQKLPYAYNALEPVIDAETVEIHYTKHNKTYVDDLNKTELALELARAAGDFSAIRALERDLAFNAAGVILHRIYWTNMTSPGRGGKPSPNTAAMLDRYFGNFDKLKQQFTAAAVKAEGGGWAALGFMPRFGHMEIIQIQSHEYQVPPGFIPLLVCDVWEHAYYLKYKNKRDSYTEAWWELVNWSDVERRLADALCGKIT